MALLAMLAVGWSGAWASEELRVLVGKNKSRIAISGSGLRIIDASGGKYHMGGRAVISAWRGGAFLLQGIRTTLTAPVRITAADNLLRRGDVWFRGSFELTSAKRGLINVINVIDLEDYLCGLVNSEINSAWPEEAVKAQVVAARTYAMWRKSNSRDAYDVVSESLDQAYHGAGGEDSAAVRAVKATLGWIMTYNGAPILAYYHSCCGGHTSSAEDIKGVDLPYIQGVSCPYCRNAPSFQWKISITARRLGQLLARVGNRAPSVSQILPLRKTPSGRIQDLEVMAGNTTLFLRGEDFRQAVGYGKIKSTRFSVTKSHGAFHFKGTGYGHGLGACQWGMKGMAEQGYSWRDILSYYYQGVEFTSIR